MGRTRILGAALIAALALGLTWGLRESDGDDARSRDERGGGSAEAPANLTGLDAGTGRAPGTDLAGVTGWDVHALDPSGRPIPEATILARKGDLLLEGSGEVEWTDVDHGEWTLEVADGESPEVTRRVTVVEGRRNSTYVTLGAPVTVRGTLMNTRGERLRDHIVGFLRPGEDVPTRPAGFRAIAHGTTDASGVYSATLPETARWRPIVVFGGKVLLEGGFETIESDGLGRRCDIVVQANPRVVFRLDEPEQYTPQGGIAALSVYRLSTPLELARDAELERRREEIAARAEAEPDPLDDGSAESQERSSEEAGATASGDDPELQERIARQAKWRRVVPEGWRRVASSVVPPSGRLVFDHLAHDVEYRVALRLDQEVFRVEPSVFLGLGEVVEAQLMPPMPRPEGTPLDEPLRTSPLSPRPIPVEGETPRAGVTWN